MNACEDQHYFDKEAAGFESDERIPLSAFIELVKPLCCAEHPQWINITEDIIAPARLCTDEERIELERVCMVFSLVLECLAHTVLSSLVGYVATGESLYTLKSFLESARELTDTLSTAYDSSVLDSFRRRLKEELIDEPF